MNKLLTLLRRIVPQYAWLPLFLIILFDLSVYYVARLITADFVHYTIETTLDRLIPFFAPAIVFYVLAYVQWGLSYIAVVRESRECCCRIFFSDVVAKLLCFVIFLFYPTEFARPEATGDGFFVWLTSFIYAADEPNNLFPSIHCLESWLCFRAVLRCRRVPRWASVCNGVMAVLVFASTLLVKQHLILDVPAGILAAEIGLFVGFLVKPEKRFLKSESPLTESI